MDLADFARQVGGLTSRGGPAGGGQPHLPKPFLFPLCSPIAFGYAEEKEKQILKGLNRFLKGQNRFCLVFPLNPINTFFRVRTSRPGGRESFLFPLCSPTPMPTAGGGPDS